MSDFDSDLDQEVKEVFALIKNDKTQTTKFLDNFYTKCMKLYINKVQKVEKLNNKLKYHLVEDTFEETYFELCRELMFGTTNYDQIVQFIKNNKDNKKFICAKIVNPGDTVWFCRDCALHPTSIICQECFDNGDHKGHRITMSRELGGSCDCGERKTWKESGFCSCHSGYSEEALNKLEDKMPENLRKNTEIVFNNIIMKLKLQLLLFDEAKESYIKHGLLVRGMFKFIEWAIDLSPVYISFLEKSILHDMPLQITQKQRKYHDCTISYRFKENEDLQNLSEKQEKPSKIKKAGSKSKKNKDEFCTCSVFDLHFTRNYNDSKHTQQIINEILMKIVASSKLKLSLAQAYIANYEYLVTYEKQEEGTSALIDLKTQILTVDEVGLGIFKNKKLRDFISEYINAHITNITENGEEDDEYTTEMQLMLDDLRLMSLPRTASYIANETDFIEQFISSFSLFQNFKPAEKQTTHIEYEEEAFASEFQALDPELVQVLKIFLAALDMKNQTRTTEVMKQFIDTLLAVQSQNKEDETQKGHFIMPIYKAFGFYLTRFVMYGYLQNEHEFSQNQQSIGITKEKVELVVSQIRQQIQSCLPNEEALENFLSRLLVQLTNTIKFLLEIKSNYWVYSGEMIQGLYDDVYCNKTSSLYMYLSLYQMIIFISENSNKHLNEIVQSSSLTYYHKLIEDIYVKKDLSNIYELGDDVKLRKYLHLSLDWLIKIQNSEITLLFPLIYRFKRRTTIELEDSDGSNVEGVSEGGTVIGPSLEIEDDDNVDIFQNKLNTQQNTNSLGEAMKQSEEIIQQTHNDNFKHFYYSNDEISHKAREMFREQMKREIIHALLLAPGKNKLSKIKKRTSKLYSSSKMFEKVLMEIADSTQSQNEKDVQMSFTLKQEYLKWFDPYYYYLDEDFHKAQESIKQLKNERNHINDYLGDFNYQYQTMINSIIAEKYALSDDLLKMVVTFINIYSTEDYSQQQIRALDAQITQDCFKLIIIMLRAINLSTQDKKEQFANEVNRQLLQSLNQSIEYICIKQSPELQPHMLIILQEQINLFSSLDLQYEVQQVQLLISKLTKKYDEENKDQNNQNNLSLQQQNDWKKEAARLKREEILNKFKNKRSNFINKQQDSQQSLTEGKQEIQEEEKQSYTINNDSNLNNLMSRDRINSEDHQECAYCRETLTIENFFSNPYGQFAYVSKSKLMYHAINQTIEAQKLKYQDQEALKRLEEEEWIVEEEGYAKQKINYVKELKPSYLSEAQYTGGTLIKCPHYAHSKCLQTYLESQKGDSDTKKERKILGLGENTHQCPLCKSLSNILFPAEDLSVIVLNDQIDVLQNVQVSEIYTELFSFIIKNQNCDQDYLDGQEIFKDPATLVITTQKFIEHRIQMIDLRGIDDFINGRQSGFKDYTKILKIIKNTLYILNKIQDKNTDTQKQILDQIQNEEQQPLTQNTSSLFIKLLYYGYIQSSIDQFKEYRNKHLSICLYLTKLQSILRALTISQKDLREDNKNEFLNDLQNLQNAKQNIVLEKYKPIIQEGLDQFVNKAFAMLLLTDSDIAYKKEPESLIKELLNLDEEQSLLDYNITSYEGVLPDNLQHANHQFEQALKEMIQNVQDQQLQQNNESIKVDTRLWLMTPKYTFEFIDLASEFQSMVLQFYKLKCRWCKIQPQLSVVCLVCGEVLCFIQSCCYDREGMKNEEGELTFHTRTCEGGCSLYLDTQQAQLYLIEKKRSSERPSPYLNKYGESYSIKTKKYDNYYLDQKYGGQKILENYKRMYMDFTICNQIIKDRATKTSSYRAGRM